MKDNHWRLYLTELSSRLAPTDLQQLSQVQNPSSFYKDPMRIHGSSMVGMRIHGGKADPRDPRWRWGSEEHERGSNGLKNPWREKFNTVNHFQDGDEDSKSRNGKDPWQESGSKGFKMAMRIRRVKRESIESKGSKIAKRIRRAATDPWTQYGSTDPRGSNMADKIRGGNTEYTRAANSNK